jgi:hypothetical protein
MSTMASPPPSSNAPAPAAPRARDTRYDTLRMLLRSPTFIAGAVIVLWWIVCAIAAGLLSFSRHGNESVEVECIPKHGDGHVDNVA